MKRKIITVVLSILAAIVLSLYSTTVLIIKRLKQLGFIVIPYLHVIVDIGRIKNTNGNG